MYRQDVLAFLHFLLQHKYKLLLISALGAMIALGWAFTQPKKYRATAVIYPTGGNDAEKSMQFGLDLHSDQLMQILNSNAMRDSLNRFFKLSDYYGVNTQQLGWEQQLDKQYRADVNFAKTRYLSINIQVSTTQPELSAAMANKIIDYTRLIYNNLLGQSTAKLKENALQTLAFEEGKMQQLADSLRNMLAHKGDSIQVRLIRQGLQDAQKRVSLARDKASYFTDRHAHPNPALLVLDHAKPDYRKASPSYFQFVCLGAIVGFFLLLAFLVAQQLFLSLSAQK